VQTAKKIEKSCQDPRRGSIISLSRLETRPRPLKKAFDLGKKYDADKARTEGRRSSRSQSLELDYRNLRDGQTVHLSGGGGVKTAPPPDKTFSVTLLVNENEKNVIVDMINRAKTIISRKVEKVIGKKPKAGVSNVETLQTVLESWIGREESREREEKAEEEQLIREQEQQVVDMARRGLPLPVAFAPGHQDEEPAAPEGAASSSSCTDMEVSRISWDRRPPAAADDGRALSPSSATRQSATPTLSAAENVPCPWGMRPDSELYPPRLRRPSSMYGAEAAAASSRPPSRLLLAAPSSRPHSRQLSTSPLPASFVTPVMEESSNDSTVVLNEDENPAGKEAEAAPAEDEKEEEDVVPVCRPASFLIPIGGVWRPEDDAGENEIVWGKEEKKENTGAGGAGVPHAVFSSI